MATSVKWTCIDTNDGFISTTSRGRHRNNKTCGRSSRAGSNRSSSNHYIHVFHLLRHADSTPQNQDLLDYCMPDDILFHEAKFEHSASIDLLELLNPLSQACTKICIISPPNANYNSPPSSHPIPCTS
eukprot:TRINITY_DN17985_c0_g1_i1.p1 TRINITY_DN17985_c0_g1~~TRINITY_DN17985_c0_g1_i1.p1  ORF type:complete len:128 (+),score=4.14 TRINITY_DN17985_c0_g1_i1:53-436(+)